jgi:hypothetical protein
VPYTTNVAGTTITAAWGNSNVRDQVVTPFATAAARTSAIASPVQGMLSYRNDLGSGGGFEGYNGTAWVPAATQLISATTLGSTAASVTFSSIPQVYGTLLVVGLAAVSAAVKNNDCGLQFNSDAGTHYEMNTWDANQAAQNPVGSFTTANTSLIWAAAAPGTTYGNTGRAGAFSILIPGYANTTMQKISLHDMFMADGGTSYDTHKRAGNWNQTSAITSMVLTATGTTFTSGSYFALYGMP